MTRELLGIIICAVFCFLSGAFDVFVGHMTQILNPMLLGFYCFLSTTLLFGLLKLSTDRHRLKQKVRAHFNSVILLNLSVVMTWAGLFYALKFLEPAVVGVLSVALGPALTIVIGLFIGNIKATNSDKLISVLVLFVVLIMLVNSFLGHSGVTGKSVLERLLGISSILICAIGSVSYTLVSKSLSNKGWFSTELLAVRNILMILVSYSIIYTNHISLFVGHSFVAPIILLVVFGHLIPIYLFQKAVTMISALQISIVLLSLPVFTLLLQYFDARVSFSLPTLISTAIILILMSTSLTIKFYQKSAI